MLYKKLSDFNDFKGKSKVRTSVPSWLQNIIIIIIKTTRILKCAAAFIDMITARLTF